MLFVSLQRYRRTKMDSPNMEVDEDNYEPVKNAGSSSKNSKKENMVSNVQHIITRLSLPTYNICNMAYIHF